MPLYLLRFSSTTATLSDSSPPLPGRRNTLPETLAYLNLWLHPHHPAGYRKWYAYTEVQQPSRYTLMLEHGDC